MGGGVQLGPLGTAVTDWSIEPASGEYDDGEFGEMKIGHFVHHKSHLNRSGIEPGSP